MLAQNSLKKDPAEAGSGCRALKGIGGAGAGLESAGQLGDIRPETICRILLDALRLDVLDNSDGFTCIFADMMLPVENISKVAPKDYMTVRHNGPPVLEIVDHVLT
jgi:hypothetical protein